MESVVKGTYLQKKKKGGDIFLKEFPQIKPF